MPIKARSPITMLTTGDVNGPPLQSSPCPSDHRNPPTVRSTGSSDIDNDEGSKPGDRDGPPSWGSLAGKFQGHPQAIQGEFSLTPTNPNQK